MSLRTACWFAGLTVAILGWALGNGTLIDAAAQARLNQALADEGVELSALSTSYALLNLPNDDGYYGPDIVLRGVTLRFRGVRVHADTMSIYCRPPFASQPGGPLRTSVVFEPEIGRDGSRRDEESLLSAVASGALRERTATMNAVPWLPGCR